MVKQIASDDIETAERGLGLEPPYSLDDIDEALAAVQRSLLYARIGDEGEQAFGRGTMIAHADAADMLKQHYNAAEMRAVAPAAQEKPAYCRTSDFSSPGDQVGGGSSAGYQMPDDLPYSLNPGGTRGW